MTYDPAIFLFLAIGSAAASFSVATWAIAGFIRRRRGWHVLTRRERDEEARKRSWIERATHRRFLSQTRHRHSFRSRAWLLKAGGIALLLGSAVSGTAYVKQWPIMLTVRHLASAPNCSAARAVGLAPSNRGEPGYWQSHDADGDGKACEPWPRR